jgi:hypothetical protein
MPRNVFIVLIILLAPFLAFAEKSEKKVPTRAVLGWMEKAIVFPGELELQAKLDTGRLGSSIAAYEIQRFTKNKKSWVKFLLKDRYGKKASIERKILRHSTLKSRSGKIYTEYVVELGFCMGGKYFEDELSLSSSIDQSYEIRLGRQSLEGHYQVDPAVTYTTKPDCKPENNSK